MKRNTILVVSSDIEYVTSIECILATELDYRYNLEVITDKDYLEEYLEDSHKIEVLVIEDNMMSAFSDAQIVGRAIIISDGEGRENVINKLDGAEAILRNLGSKYLKATSQMGNITSKVIDVVSVSGGSGKTITALGIATQLTAMRKKVLYIDAENYQNFYEYVGSPTDERGYFESADIGILLEPEKCTMAALDKEIVRGRFDFVAPFKGNLVKYQINEKCLYYAARRLADENVYDYIVVEHGCIYDREFFAYLNGSERIVLTTRSGAIESMRIGEFLNDIRQFSGQMVIVRNRLSDIKNYSSRIEYEEGSIPVSEHVQEFKQQMTLQLVNEYGLYKKTAEAIM